MRKPHDLAARSGLKLAPTPGEGARLRRPWPFRRVALVLSGGGALGAYEVGVLRVLERVGLKPAILAGTSVGAINAAVWLAHDFKTAALEKAWRGLRGSSIGMRWVTIALRAGGGFLLMLGVIELVLTLAGTPELQIPGRLRRLEDIWGFEFYTILFECLAWILVGALGVLIGRTAGRVDDALVRLGPTPNPELWQRWLSLALVVATVLYVVAAVFGLPWPWRFHGLLLVVLFMTWLINRPGRPREWMKRMFLRLMPETGGRGLWRSTARTRLIERLVERGDPKRLVTGDPHLIVSACAVDTGRMSYFVNWPDPSPEFKQQIHLALGDVVEVLKVRDVIQATTASCAVPVLFEPIRFRGHDYLDGGVFSNQPLRAVVADGADAILCVLNSPSTGPSEPSEEWNVVELSARLRELAAWRDVQTELFLLPAGWSRDGRPANLCVIEPDHVVPGQLFSFDPQNAQELIELGEKDGWRLLEEAGWIER